MLVCTYGRLIDGLVVALYSNVINHDCAVIATNSKECWVLGVEVQAHHSSLSIELVLWEGRVLDCVAADKTSVLLQEIVRAIADSEEVLISGVPANGGYMLFS